MHQNFGMKFSDLDRSLYCASNEVHINCVVKHTNSLHDLQKNSQKLGVQKVLQGLKISEIKF